MNHMPNQDYRQMGSGGSLPVQNDEAQEFLAGSQVMENDNLESGGQFINMINEGGENASIPKSNRPKTAGNP